MKSILKFSAISIPIVLVGMLIFAHLQTNASIRLNYTYFSKVSLKLAKIVGHPTAGHMLASMQVFKSDNEKEQREGFHFLEKEYESGSAYSAGKLGWAYQRGLGVDRDSEKAIQLYQEAASRGMTYWQFLLAHAYEEGYLGFSVDKEKAKYWIEKKPKIHIAKYECWVANFYDDGIFPKDEEKRNYYDAECSKSDT